jgi:hypothetical protein
MIVFSVGPLSILLYTKPKSNLTDLLKVKQKDTSEYKVLLNVIISSFPFQITF